MKNEPQIFTRTDDQNVPVDDTILGALEQEGLTESLVREYIREILTEAAQTFEKWLSPQVVDFLIDNYAESSSVLGQLRWEYGKLRGRVWGKYVFNQKKLYVNKAKTEGMFRQQVETILHEIQHWNQHVQCSLDKRSTEARWRHADDPAKGATHDFATMCMRNKQEHGYWKAPHEIDARKFAEDNIDDAMSRAGKQMSGKVEVDSEDEAWEDILDELADLPVVSRLDIGKALGEYDMNTPENMKHAMAELKELGVTVK